MTTTLNEAIRVLRKHAETDPALAETVLLLAEDAAGPDEPFAEPSQAVRGAARLVNERRQRERRAALLDQTIDTAEIIEIIESIQDRKGVDRRRRRGRLMGWRFRPPDPSPRVAVRPAPGRHKTGTRESTGSAKGSCARSDGGPGTYDHAS